METHDACLIQGMDTSGFVSGGNILAVRAASCKLSVPVIIQHICCTRLLIQTALVNVCQGWNTIQPILWRAEAAQAGSVPVISSCLLHDFCSLSKGHREGYWPRKHHIYSPRGCSFRIHTREIINVKPLLFWFRF